MVNFAPSPRVLVKLCLLFVSSMHKVGPTPYSPYFTPLYIYIYIYIYVCVCVYA
jgi:hypothetical protein